MNKFFAKNPFIILLAIFVAFIALQNYLPGTFLSGWDNYQTDLNPWLGVKRAVFSVWQEGQSLGLVAGMGHAADLVRALFVWIMSWIIPQSLLRYGFHFVMLLSGVWGMFQLLKFIGFDKEKQTIAFIGSLFYLLNFGTIQILFIPFESFSVMYGILPWAVWIFLRLIRSQHLIKKDLFLFVLFNIIITPQGLSQQLFVTYSLLLGFLTAGYFYQHRSLTVLKHALLGLVIIFMVNAFWLLPQIYFLKTSGGVIKEAKANQLHTINIFNQNLTKGTIPNFLLMRGFHYDLLDTGRSDGLFQSWKTYFNNPFISVIVAIVAIIPLIGLFSKRKFHFAFVAGYLLVALALLLYTLPFSFINGLLRHNDFLSQVFRSPFTKFIIPYSLIASYLFASGIDVLSKIPKKDTNMTDSVITSLAILCIIIYSLPAFLGNYFSPRMKVEIPKEYFDVFDYLKTQNHSKRIALLPDYTFWGWTPYKWGYLGSGFLWYGIEQPIVSRTFDVWSLESESYFWQIKQALEAEDMKRLETILEKYNITYLLLDRSLLGYGNSIKTLQYDRIENLLARSTFIKQVKKNDVLDLYEYIPTIATSDHFVSLSDTDLPNIGPQTTITDNDTAYTDFKTYQTDDSIPYNAYYPFLGLASETRTKNPLWNIKETNDGFSIETDLKQGLSPQNYSIYMNPTDTEYIEPNNTVLDTYDLPVSINISSNTFSAQFPKKIIESIPLAGQKVNNWNTTGSVGMTTSDNAITITGNGLSQPNISYFSPSIIQSYGYIAKIETENIENSGLYINIDDMTKQQRVIEDKIKDKTEYYLLPPHYKYGIGYSTTLYNYSYPNVPTQNTISSLTYFALPYDQLKNVKFLNKKTPPNANITQPIIVDHNNYFSYVVSDIKKDAKTIILWQSFHPGWKAYIVERGTWNVEQYLPFLFGNELKQHVPINSWANGWKLRQNPTYEVDKAQIVIIFWPQYLEFIGLFILFIVIASSLLFQNKEYN